MIAFADRHHGDLTHSLSLLFEKRLGWELYFPIGIEWFNRGFFKIAEPYGNAPDTIEQYLGINNRVWDPYKNLNGGDYHLEDGIYFIWDPVHEAYIKCITFDKFLELNVNVIIASHPLHDEVFRTLQIQHKPQAKLIGQIGNHNQMSIAPNILTSTAWQPADRHTCYYHQEFDTQIFTHSGIQKFRLVSSLQNCLPQSPDYGIWCNLKNYLKDYEFKSYGGSCDDGSLQNSRQIATQMQKSMFVWQVKAGGDGYGHNIHQTMACGTPLIVRKGYHTGQIADRLLIDGETCITIDGKQADQIVRDIRIWSEPDNYRRLQEGVAKKYREMVNFTQEEEEIRAFLDTLT